MDVVSGRLNGDEKKMHKHCCYWEPNKSWGVCESIQKWPQVITWMCFLHPTKCCPPIPPSITARSLLWRLNVISPGQAEHVPVQINRTWFHQSWPLNYKWRWRLLPKRLQQCAEIPFTPSRHHQRSQPLFSERMPFFVSLHFMATLEMLSKGTNNRQIPLQLSSFFHLFNFLSFVAHLWNVLFTADSPGKWGCLPLSRPFCPLITALAVFLSEWWINPV